MAKSQAIILICDDMEISEEFKNFLDINLNLYSYKEIRREKLVEVIMSDTLTRQALFNEMEIIFQTDGPEHVIVFGHLPCQNLANDQDQSQHEIFLRHSVSVIRARFPDKEISAYLEQSREGIKEFNQVI